MPIPIARLKKEHKLDPDSLKKAFDAKSIESRPLVKKLIKQISDTIKNGVERNRVDYRLYKAMDWAYDTPFYQVSLTQLRGLLNSSPDENKVKEVVNQWGLTHLLPDKLDENGKVCCQPGTNKPIKALNLPVFFNIFVPVVMAYITIRWAKLFNDRNLVPFYKYEPVTFTKENRFRAEVITQVVQRQSTWFDYPGDLRQSILQTLLYGFCINFPREAWHVERQEGEDGEPKIVREGLRWTMPHPNRTYFDQYHRLSSLNSNSGCEHAGFWELLRYRDIKNNDLYWNKDKITMGSIGWFGDISGGSDFLSMVYPCAMSFPSVSSAGDLDRESAAARTYGDGDDGAATMVTQHFQRIIPADHGLGTYKYPVWFRFVFGSDTTVLWAEPLAFNVLPTYTYDADFNRARFRSLALEITPFQDHISNIMTQWILAVKENLANPIFYDKEKIPTNYAQMLQNLGQKLHNGRILIPFSSTENIRMRLDQREAFYSPQLTHHNTGEMASLVTGILSMLDRIMQLSPQEIGQAAPHEQTAEESRIIAGNTSTRLTFTGSAIDAADYAKKLAIYDATMAHADDDIIVGVTSGFAATEEEFNKLLKAVGFSLTDKDQGFDPDKPEMMHMVKGNKSKLALESFVSTRDNKNRINLPAVADAMSKLFIAVAGNPVLIQTIGPQQLVELLNQVIVASGVPQEFRLKGKPLADQPQEQQAQQLAETLKQFAEEIKKAIATSQQETLQAAAQQTTQIVGQTVSQAVQGMQAQTAQGIQAVAAQTAPAIQETQQATVQVAQKVAEHEAEITNLNTAVEQLIQAMQVAQKTVTPPTPVA